jgi:hypothetical protein
MNKKTWVVCILSLALAACGGGDDDSGVPDSKVVGQLTASEAMAVCVELAGIFPARTVDCGGGNTINVGIDPAECDEAPPATCTATVGQFRDCFGDIADLTDAQWCDANTQPPASCAPVLSAEC